LSEYRDFVHDFPLRCHDLLKTFEPGAKLRDREVTLLLAVASAGLVVPYERLRPDRPHPSGDAQRFSQAAAALAEELDKTLERFLGEASAREWLVGTTSDLNGPPDAWSGFAAVRPANQKLARTILKTIRNALAHGNVWTLGNPISELVFAREIWEAKKLVGFEFLKVSPQAFRGLLDTWFDGLKKQGINHIAGAVALDEAA
jgi:hypothetical protein